VTARELRHEQRDCARVHREAPVEAFDRDGIPTLGEQLHQRVAQILARRDECVDLGVRGVVDQDVDRAEGALGVVEQSRDRRWIGQIALPGSRTTADDVDGAQHLVGRHRDPRVGRDAEVMKQDRRALGGERSGDRGADPLRVVGAGDDDDLALEPWVDHPDGS
jgi:hypothetical protein